jgi:hypothetical protein
VSLTFHHPTFRQFNTYMYKLHCSKYPRCSKGLNNSVTCFARYRLDLGIARLSTCLRDQFGNYREAGTPAGRRSRFKAVA